MPDRVRRAAAIVSAAGTTMLAAATVGPATSSTAHAAVDQPAILDTLRQTAAGGIATVLRPAPAAVEMAAGIKVTVPARLRRFSVAVLTRTTARWNKVATARTVRTKTRTDTFVSDQDL